MIYRFFSNCKNDIIKNQRSFGKFIRIHFIKKKAEMIFHLCFIFEKKSTVLFFKEKSRGISYNERK